MKKLLFGIVLSLGVWFPRHATDVLAFHAPPGVLTRVLPGMAQYHPGDRVISKIVSIRRITVQGKKPCTGCILPGDGSGGGTLTLFKVNYEGTFEDLDCSCGLLYWWYDIQFYGDNYTRWTGGNVYTNTSDGHSGEGYNRVQPANTNVTASQVDYTNYCAVPNPNYPGLGICQQWLWYADWYVHCGAGATTLQMGISAFPSGKTSPFQKPGQYTEIC